MATLTYAEVDPALCRDLVDLVSVRYDLDTAALFCERAIDAFEDPLHAALAEIFTTAVSVRYARAFSTGIRRWDADSSIAALTDEERSTHTWIINLRNKHIAHSVNGFEESKVCARYWVERPEEGIVSIDVQHGRLSSLSAQGFAIVRDLAKKLSQMVAEKMEAMQNELLPIVRALPFDEVIKREPIPVGVFDMTAVSVSRPPRKR